VDSATFQESAWPVAQDRANLAGLKIQITEYEQLRRVRFAIFVRAHISGSLFGTGGDKTFGLLHPYN